ncbi:MAG TPA: DUF3570 domain-containing protein [Steroidobacteraceae bacterium]|nr:DUF3570 domain-containing protein [Steroidobacteraceae bacterium]
MPRSCGRVRLSLALCGLCAVCGLYSAPTLTGVLPEDTAEGLYDRYSGDNQVIEGKTWLIRKKFADKFDVQYSRVTDVVSGASVDVRLTGASPYIEQRTEDNVSMQYLRGKTTYAVGFIHSYEPDYRSNTVTYSVSQDMFGDLTTVSMNYKRQWDDIFKMVKECNNAASPCPAGDVIKVHDPAFGMKRMDERSYGIGLTQIISRNAILALNYDLITDQGFISNPYREARYSDPTVARGWSLEPEVYPHTRTSNAIGSDFKYYLPYRAAIDVQYRYYEDTFGIHSHTAQIGYTQPWRHWTFEGSFRYYVQNQADFYSDLFPFVGSQNFITANQDLSAYHSYSFGVGASYEFAIPHVPWIERSTANFRYDRLTIDYEDFRNWLLSDPAAGINPGSEPLFTLQANIYEFYLSLFF